MRVYGRQAKERETARLIRLELVADQIVAFLSTPEAKRYEGYAASDLRDALSLTDSPDVIRAICESLVSTGKISRYYGAYCRVRESRSHDSR